MTMEESMKRATHQGVLRIADIEIPCFVLQDGTRVISGRGVTKAIGMKGRGQGVKRVAGHKALSPYLGDELETAIRNPIRFIGIGSRETAGYEATILQRLCDAILSASEAGALRTEQEKRYALASYVLIRAFAQVGIIALVDEATGYQEDRARDALEQILSRFISQELLKWVKTFPDEFYRQMFRLRNWEYREFSVKRPSIAGRITNDLIYERLAPGVLDELRRITPRDAKGRTRHRYHQRLTEDIGHPALREHLASVITLMKASTSWRTFYAMLNRALPKWGDTLPMDLHFEQDDETNP